MRDAREERSHRTAADQGDQLAVAELASTYGTQNLPAGVSIHRKNREDAEEVAQDVLLKVVRKIDAFRGDAALSSWIYRITFNAAMSRLRTARYQRAKPGHGGSSGRRPGKRRADGRGRQADVADWNVAKVHENFFCAVNCVAARCARFSSCPRFIARR